MSLSLRTLLPPVRLARSRTPGFHPGNRGSNPLREAILSPPHSFYHVWRAFSCIRCVLADP